jgi:superfamily II DNA or RNA helicase
MAPIHHVLRQLEGAHGIEALRRLAVGLGASTDGDATALVASIAGATGGDLAAVVGARRGLSRETWNQLSTTLGGRPRPSARAIAAELLVRAVALAPDGATFTEDDPEDEEPVPAGLPAASFDFDPDAAGQPARGYQRELVEELERVLSVSQPGRSYRINVATGGGKTRIANDWLWTRALPRGWRVLWVTKDWWLLAQAASDLCRRHDGARARLGFVGVAGRHALCSLDERVDRDVVFTSIHTWRSRRDAEFRDTAFDVVVIDESHWGEGKRAYRDLHQRYKGSARFLGLTATPRNDTRFTLVGRAYDYPTLVAMDVLARHINEEPIRTGVRWVPARSTNGDFLRSSLSELARSTQRNRCIVRTYLEGRARFGKTLMFACDIEHAEILAELLRDKGVAADALHSEMRPEDQRRRVARFRSGELTVLVNVAMMTHGVDIPAIETVFLIRPTLSRILFAQMVGRAARRTETKTHFRLVDFVDNLDVHGDLLVSPRSYFGTITDDRPGRYVPPPPRRNHEFVVAPFEHIPALPGFEEVAGFDLQPAQTFGIEFEITRDDFNGQLPADWMTIAQGLLDAIPTRRRARKPYVNWNRRPNHAVWNVKWDGSCGWEVTSRILSGPAGFYEVMEVCRALEEFATQHDLRVNRRTGTHIHLGWTATARTLERLMTLAAGFEPALYTLVAPSRSRNKFCSPVRSLLPRLRTLGSLARWERFFYSAKRRYLAVNPTHLFGRYGTIEVRLHSGTLEGRKILGWLSLWMRILEAARGRRPVPVPPFPTRELPLVSGPYGDVRSLAELVGVGHQLSDYLTLRRGVVIERWLERPGYRKRAERLIAEWRDEPQAALIVSPKP